MVKETVTYKDFDGNERTESLYFNLTVAEWLKLDASYSSKGGIRQYIKTAADKQDTESILNLFEKLLLTSYGVRTDDMRFIKRKDLSEEFGYSEAYSSLLMRFLTNTDEGTKFFERLLPKESDLPKQPVHVAQ